MSNPIPNIAGEWKMSLSGDGDKSAMCTLIQSGNVLTGTFRGPLGHLPISGAIINDGKIAFSAKFLMGSLKFFGIVDGETMNGLVDFPMGKGQKNWTAIKVIDQQNS
jgi:hypothetical protein